MLLLLAFCREQNYGLSTSIIMLEKLSAIHNYDLRTIECFKIFGPPKDFQHDEPSSDCEIVIYNIPIDESEDILVATLLAFSNLYYLKIVISKDGRHRGIAFAKFSNASEARKAIKKLETTMIYTHNNLHAKPCDTCNTNLYIGNININRNSLHKMEQIILKLVHGLESFVVYSLNKFNRYIISLIFYTVQDLLLSIHDICKCDIFIQSPEILISTVPPVARLAESMPICKYIYKRQADCKHEWPEEIYISPKKYNDLRIF